MKSFLSKNKFLFIAGLSTTAIVFVFVTVLFFSINKPNITQSNSNNSSANQTLNTNLNSSDANQETEHFNIFSILNKFITN